MEENKSLKEKCEIILQDNELLQSKLMELQNNIQTTNSDNFCLKNDLKGL